MFRLKNGSLLVPGPGYPVEITSQARDSEAKRPCKFINMSDGEEGSSSEDEQCLVKEIDKEINKLKYFLEETEELIEIKDYTEMEIVNKRAENIITKLSDLVSQTKELKIEQGLSP